MEDVRLDGLVAAAVERARRHAPRVDASRPSSSRRSCSGVPARLDRAVANLLDNAAKWSPPGASVEVRLRDGELTVRDHGPGIAAADRAHRLRPLLPRRRGPRAPRLRASGLAIVRQVAEAHGGTVQRGGRRRRRRAAAPAPAGPLSKSLGSAEGGLMPDRRRWRA